MGFPLKMLGMVLALPVLLLLVSLPPVRPVAVAVLLELLLLLVVV